MKIILKKSFFCILTFWCHLSSERILSDHSFIGHRLKPSGLDLDLDLDCKSDHLTSTDKILIPTSVCFHSTAAPSLLRAGDWPVYQVLCWWKERVVAIETDLFFCWQTQLWLSDSTGLSIKRPSLSTFTPQSKSKKKKKILHQFIVRIRNRNTIWRKEKSLTGNDKC